LERNDPAAGDVSAQLFCISWFYFHPLVRLLADNVNKPRLVSFILFTAEFPFCCSSSAAPWGFFGFYTALHHCRSHLSGGLGYVGDILRSQTLREDSRLHEYVLCLGSVLGPVVAGAIWDRWQSYEPMLWVVAAMFFVSGAFYSALGKPWARPSAL